MYLISYLICDTNTFFVKFGISLVFINVLLVYVNPNCLSRLFECGDEGTRTPDLRLAKAPLSQLSYIPRKPSVGLGGLEPPTSRLSGVRSNQLSYRPGYLFGNLHRDLTTG